MTGQIAYFAHVVSEGATLFQNRLEEHIEACRDNFFDTEIQYQTVVNNEGRITYTAIIIGRVK